MIISWQVHGGTTATDIVKKVQKAERIATCNKRNDNVDTVLFFDEANTTEAIGLIKEIMCDGRAHGKHISMANGALKIVAACNPYRRYTLLQYGFKVTNLYHWKHVSFVTFMCAQILIIYITAMQFQNAVKKISSALFEKCIAYNMDYSFPVWYFLNCLVKWFGMNSICSFFSLVKIKWR